MTKIYAAPVMGKVIHNKCPVDAYDLQTAINKAKPGDVIFLTKGTYSDPVTMARSGLPEQPITICGPGDGSVIIDGRRHREDGILRSRWIMDGDWSFFKFFDVAHIHVHGLSFRNCWPNAIFIRGGSDMQFRDLDIKHGRNVIYARNGAENETQRILIEGVSWVQDPDHDMWEGRVSWREVKGQVKGSDKSWFNGALFQSFRITGDITIRDCSVSHAFNGIRMKVKETDVDASGPKIKLDLNRNIRIYRNRFSYIRDNAVEPEIGLNRWLVAENWFFQVHAALSLDGVAIQDLTFICNRLLNLSRPEDASNTSGKIIKFVNPDDEASATRSDGFVTAFNAIRTRTRFVKGARLKPWISANEAIERFAVGPKDDKRLFQKVVWQSDVVVAGLATNDPDFPVNYPDAAPCLIGHRRINAVFEPAPFKPDMHKELGGWNGTFALSHDAAALGSVPVTLTAPDGTKTTVKSSLPPGYHSLEALGLQDWID